MRFGSPVNRCGSRAVEAFLLAEVVQYWAHRAAHTVPVLWRFHKVHHSITELDWLAAARLHPIDQAFIRSCVVIPLFVLGFTSGTFGALLVLFTFQALFIHANVRFTFGPLRYVFATPEFHHWHHADDPRAYNSNFAGELPAARQALRHPAPVEGAGATVARVVRSGYGGLERAGRPTATSARWPGRSGRPPEPRRRIPAGLGGDRSGEGRRDQAPASGQRPRR